MTLYCLLEFSATQIMSSRRLSRERERERDRCLGELAFIELPFLLERGERERDLIIIFYLKLFFYYFYLYQK